MKKLVIQFHAIPHELNCFLVDLQNEIQFSKGIMEKNPFNLKAFSKTDVVDFEKQLPDEGGVSVILSVNENLQIANSPNQFFDNNPDCLVVCIGKYCSETLMESSLSGFFEKNQAITFAKKIASRLKKITMAGVVAVNPHTEAEANIKNHRYTNGAKAFYAQGGRISPVAGGAYLKILDY